MEEHSNLLKNARRHLPQAVSNEFTPSEREEATAWEDGPPRTAQDISRSSVNREMAISKMAYNLLVL